MGEELQMPKWAGFHEEDYQEPPDWSKPLLLDFGNELCEHNNDAESLAASVSVHRYEIVALREQLAEAKENEIALRRQWAELDQRNEQWHREWDDKLAAARTDADVAWRNGYDAGHDVGRADALNEAVRELRVADSSLGCMILRQTVLETLRNLAAFEAEMGETI